MFAGATRGADYYADGWGQIHLLSASGTDANGVDDRRVAISGADGKPGAGTSPTPFACRFTA